LKNFDINLKINQVSIYLKSKRIINKSILLKKKLILKGLFYLLKISKKQNRTKFYENFNKIKFFKKKISKFLSNFTELEIDLVVANQSFDFLERRRKNYLWNSFKNISYEFLKLFKKLFGNGNASLIFHFKTVEELYLKKKFFKKSFTGFSILTQFQKNSIPKPIEENSDGQVSLILVIFLLSVKNIITSRIFFFDEIDSNFDSSNNKYFIYLIKQFASAQNQFFIISFKKNSILKGDKWYFIYIKDKGGKIEAKSKNFSLKFVRR